MNSSPFTQKPQFHRGKNVEAFLDDFFTYRGWRITQTSPHEERVLCIGDRWYSRGSEVYCIEYKSGIQTYYRGNVFLETVSVDTQNKRGWVYTCQADFIFYAALLNQKILMFTPAKLRSVIETLRTKFREVPTSHQQNDGYNTWGVIVPLEYAETFLAEKVVLI